jgi:carboxypeptidase D
LGESYAGLLPISSNKNDTNQLYFWFFPTTNPAAQEEIVIWLTGGPGKQPLKAIVKSMRELI